MPAFVVTYWLHESRQRQQCGGFGNWPGAHNTIVHAVDMADAMSRCPAPSDDCYRVEIAPIHKDKGDDE